MLKLKMKWRALPRFVAMVAPYWFSQDKWVARGLLVLLIPLLLGTTAMNVLLNMQSGEFTSALAAHDSHRFWVSIYKVMGIIATAAPFYVFYYYVRDKLANYWRRWLTYNYLDLYFRNDAFYNLPYYADIDNPDQRIAEDVNSFTTKSMYYLLLVCENVVQLIAFSGVLWAISKTLVMFLLGYAIVGTLLTTLIFGRTLVALNFFQLRREADLRFSLVRLRENAESIAFYRGEEPESANIKHKFDAAFGNYNRIINWQWFLNLFQYAFSSVTLVFPAVILASQVLSGKLEVGQVVQASGAFVAIFTALTIIVNNFDTLSRFVAGISRLDKFSKALEMSATESRKHPSVIKTVEENRLGIEQLSLQTPDYQRSLVKNLSLEIQPMEGLLIVGVSGGGKSSLLRAIAGLWTSGTGTIIRPPLDEMFFLPQHPYMIIGSLRAQLIYPNDKKQVTDDELHDVLKAVNLADLPGRLGGLDKEADWGKILSLGEQQRIAFARVLLAQPRFVILDEATSALDADNEDRLYQRLQDLKATIVSVAHRLTILKYHHRVLTLGNNGTWSLMPTAEFKAKQ